jgi:hypothetical protein
VATRQITVALPPLAKPVSDGQVVAALVALLTRAEPAPTRTVG